jgi:hypothetical protein
LVADKDRRVLGTPTLQDDSFAFEVRKITEDHTPTSDGAERMAAKIPASFCHIYNPLTQCDAIEWRVHICILIDIVHTR